MKLEKNPRNDVDVALLSHEQLSEDTRRYRGLLEAAIVKIANENKSTIQARRGEGLY
jgi:hypothetical protein